LVLGYRSLRGNPILKSSFANLVALLPRRLLLNSWIRFRFKQSWLFFLNSSRIEAISKERVDTDFIGWTPAVAVRMNVHLQALLFIIHNDLVPLQAYTFGFFNIWNCEHRAVLILYFYGLLNVGDVVGYTAVHLLGRHLFVRLSKCTEVLHNARGCRICGQVAKDHSNPAFLTHAARIVSEPKFYRHFGLVLRTIFTSGFKKLVYMFEGFWVMELNQANGLHRVSLSIPVLCGLLLHAVNFIYALNAGFFSVTFGANGSS
jgi:hypothetical protein